jgi:hypothetical protein
VVNRAFFQKTQTKLPAQILLGRQSKCDRNPGLVCSDLLVTNGSGTKSAKKNLGFFQHGRNRLTPSNQLCAPDKLPQQPGKRTPKNPRASP